MKYRTGLVAAFGVVASMVACSSSSSTSANAADGGASSSGGSAAACAKQTTFLACVNCCNPPQSYFDGQDAFNKCVCDTACKTECADSCSTNGQPSAACKACIDADATGTTCTPKAQAVCDADPACKAYQACANGAKCDDKGDGPDGG